MDTAVNLVVFASRESLPELIATLLCAAEAVPENSKIDVIINGNINLSEQARNWISRRDLERSKQIQIWNILAGDKGNAWNEHIHTIWQGEMDAIYIDGYVRVRKHALSAMCKTLANNTLSLGTSALPTIGASAAKVRRQMLAQGGFHGNLCAIKSTALEQMRIRNIRIPLGMYRVDGLAGAFLSFGLDNLSHKWDPIRFIPVTTDASWESDEKKWYRLQNIIAWKKRRDRQARGDIENAAIKFHLTDLQCPLEELPGDVNNLVAAWTCSRPLDARAIINRSSRHHEAMVLIKNYVPLSQSAYNASRVSNQE